MDNKIKVSVLITFYNQKEFVERSVSSVLKQEVDFPFEILIGDDGSSDGTWELIQEIVGKAPEIIKAYQWSRAQDVKYEPIVRASENRLRLVRLARGEYLTILDGDDYYCDRTKLATQVSVLDQNQDYSCCAHNMNYVNAEGEILGTTMPQTVTTKVFSFNWFWCFYYQPAEAFLFRRPDSRIMENMIDPANFDDNTIVFALSQFGRIFYLSSCMVNYYKHSDSSWEGRDMLERRIFNLRDYCYEVDRAPEKKIVSMIRHNSIRSWLISVGYKELLIDGILDRFPFLLKSPSFGHTWDHLTHDSKIASFLYRRCQLAIIGIIRFFKSSINRFMKSAKS